MTRTTKPRKTSKKLAKIIEKAVKQVSDDIRIEKLSPMFFDSTRFLKQPCEIYRIDLGKDGLYYRFIDGEPVFYMRTTAFIKKTLPTSPELIKWMVNKGERDAEEELDERSKYGTFMHIEDGSLLIKGKYDLDTLKSRLEPYLIAEKLPAEKICWAEALKKDVLAFAQFVIDYNVKPLAVEIALYHPTDGYAGSLDVVCEMDWEEKGCFGEVYKSGENKGQPKETKRTIRVNAIIDLKSGRKGFYESHEIQLGAYKEMFNVHFPEIKIDKLFNFSPKDWRGKVPTYNLKDQTDSKNIKKLPHLVGLAKVEAEKRDDSVTICSGMIDLVGGIGCNVSEKSIVELVKGERIL